jgi:hypothetical protein
VLDSWKEIAGYLRRTVRTVQRWERSERLPVHRQPHARVDSVFAYADELDAWRERSCAAVRPSVEVGKLCRIAVLGFEWSGSPDDRILGESLADDVARRLACYAGLEVIARPSVKRLTEQRRSLRQIGAAIKCDCSFTEGLFTALMAQPCRAN